VHGLSNPGTDDRDEMGVCIEPPEYLLGFQRFEHFVYRTQPEGAPSGPGDLDLTVYGLRRYCRLALKGSPTVLLPLFVTGEHVVARTALGAELHEVRDARATHRVPGHRAAQARTDLIPVPEPERAELRAVRSGNVPLDEVLAKLDRVTAALAGACDTPGLPAQSDVAAVDAFVVSAYRRAWDARDAAPAPG
jgi:hypothetical protein